MRLIKHADSDVHFRTQGSHTRSLCGFPVLYVNVLITAFLVFCQKEVLRLLVNLSCNDNNLEGLLEYKVCEVTLHLKAAIQNKLAFRNHYVLND